MAYATGLVPYYTIKNEAFAAAERPSLASFGLPLVLFAVNTLLKTLLDSLQKLQNKEDVYESRGVTSLK